MPTKKVAHKEKMANKKSGSAVTNWVPSEFKESDLNKGKKEGSSPEKLRSSSPSTSASPSPGAVIG
jgi:hypothetical protein